MVSSSYSPGDTVRLRADQRREGAILAVLESIGGEARYRVFHGPGESVVYFHSQLEAVNTGDATGDVAARLLNSPGLKGSEFVAKLTAARLAHPQTDGLYSLFAARIQHIPFQYKPLLRLLRSDRPRILIADEVGVGKTIEAGLILKELQSRQSLDRILIVCPKSLVAKWKSEMRRFDEDFRPLTSESLRYCINETYKEGVWPAEYNRAIVHLELIRNADYLHGKSQRANARGLLELQPPPFFDLLIVDEVHHIRNQPTLSYEAVRFLTEQSEAAVFLSATPVHLGTKDLFTLLHLLRPDLFLDVPTFSAMAEPNIFLTNAMRSIRSQLPSEDWTNDAAMALSLAGQTGWGAQTIIRDRKYLGWLQRLGSSSPLTDGERVAAIRDIEEFHTLSHVMNRTRRRDITKFTLREPHTVSVPFTPLQQLFYEALLEFRKEVLLCRFDPNLTKLILDTLERQASSCLPALIPSLASFVRTGRFRTTEFSDDLEIDVTELPLPVELQNKAANLLEMGRDLPPDDPKLDQLIRIAKDSQVVAGPGKVLVFSFFLHTLQYLRRNLLSQGIRTEIISGEVADDIRESFRDRFRLERDNPDTIDVLLSSEVGCEGLDYEFCDKLVNYDIPWNPMRIEQRIGRIDRFGQQAEKVLIFNFVTPGTVEERIFFRCFERLGVFRDTVGDLEAVLGELVADLTGFAFDPTLSPSQAEQKAQQRADNVLRLAHESQRLENESDGLIGLDKALEQDIETIKDEGRFVSSVEVKAMISFYLSEFGASTKFSSDIAAPGTSDLTTKPAAKAELLNQLRKLEHTDRTTSEMERWLNSDSQTLRVTFDQSIALQQRQLPFITPIHALSKMAVHHLRDEKMPLMARIAVQTELISSGIYLFVCELWETVAVRPSLRMLTVGWDLDRERLEAGISSHFFKALTGAGEVTCSYAVDEQSLSLAIREIDEYLYGERQVQLHALRDRNQELLTRKLASLEASNRNRIQKLDEELQASTSAKIVKMMEGHRSRIESSYKVAKAKLESQSHADVTTTRIAFGILEVTRGK